MNIGNRKFMAFMIGICAIVALMIYAMIKSITMTGDNLEHIAWIIFFMVAMFQGANVGEWFAKTKIPHPEPPAAS